ncbi:MAG: rRNA maturation RNase YbeY [Bacilli bacterium]|nr:rRNA maturation RNase YbeY [Bacilli bacterium]
MFEIINDTDKNILELDFLNNYIKYVVNKLDINDAIFNIIFVSDEKIHEINKTYRGVDRVTDVISFALEDGEDIKNNPIRVLGDIYIAIDVAYLQAEEYGHSKIREVCFLATHGLLHLLGYDHMNEDDEKIMFDKQREILDGYEVFR